MGKKFAEYSQFDLSKVNAEVLKKWDENQVFAKSMTEREGCDLCGTVQDEEPEAGNGRVGDSIFHCMDHHSMDIAFKYRALRRSEDRLCSRTKLQWIHRRKNHRCTCQSFALHTLQ